ncbi:MAG: peptidoglycan-binding protein [Clostridia bacterium]|nr:peptidoglycan-binding protein [Clostridia bacterium]
MKKLLSLCLVLLILFTGVASAENDYSFLKTYTDEELLAMQEALTAEINSRGQIGTSSVKVATYETLQKGSKGDKVVSLQSRLIELNYLQSRADGDFGNKTTEAVKLFQKTAGLSVTGIADQETQEALYAKDAPKAKVYLTLDFKGISRDPDSHNGNQYKFTGKVLQVLEEKMENYTCVCMRIATKGNYDDVVYVTYLRKNSEARILEDDRVTVYATCLGLYTYETVMGSSVTLPNFLADTISVQ